MFDIIKMSPLHREVDKLQDIMFGCVRPNVDKYITVLLQDNGG